MKHERETDRVTRTEDERPVSSLPFPFLSSHSLPLSPYTHILDLEVKEAEANAVRRSGMSRERWDVRVRT